MTAADALALLEEADKLGYSREKTTLLTRAVELAAQTGDLDAEWRARHELVSATFHYGEPQVGMVHLTWTLAKMDAEPGRFDERSALWQLKWVPGLLAKYPDSSQAQLEELLADIRRRFTAAGTGGDAIAMLDYELSLQLGRPDEALARYQAWRLVPRTNLSDCRACVVANEVWLRRMTGQLDLAMLAAEPLLTGALSCVSQPASTIATLLESMWERGDPALASSAERVHDSIGVNPDRLGSAGLLLRHWIRVGDLEAAARLAPTVARWGARTHVPRERMYAAASLGALEAARRDAGLLPDPELDVLPDPAETARRLAAAFDLRNGNSWVGEEIETILATRPQTSTVAAQPVAEAPAVVEETVDELLVKLRESFRLRPGMRQAMVDRVAERGAELGRDDIVARADRVRVGLLLSAGRRDEAAELIPALPDRLGDAHPYDRLVASVLLGELDDDSDPTPLEERPWMVRARAHLQSVPADRMAEARGALAFAALRTRSREELPSAEEFAGCRAAYDENQERIAATWAFEASLCLQRGELDRALACITSALEVGTVEEIGDFERARYLHIAALIHERRSPREADPVYVEARTCAARSGDPGLSAMLAERHANLLEWLGDHESELAARYDIVDAAARMSDPTFLGWARVGVGATLRSLGRHQEAYDLWSDLLKAQDENTDRTLRGAVALSLATCDADFEFFDDAARYAAVAEEFLDPTASERAGLAGVQARLAAHREDLEAATTFTDLAVALCLERRDSETAIAVLGHLVDAHVKAGDGDAALARLAQMESIDPDTHQNLARARILMELGRTAEATALARSLPTTTAGETWDAARVALRTGDRDRAAELFDLAIDHATRDGVDDTGRANLRARADRMLNPQ